MLGDGPAARIVMPVTTLNGDEAVELTATWKLPSHDNAVHDEQTLMPDRIVAQYLQVSKTRTTA